MVAPAHTGGLAMPLINLVQHLGAWGQAHAAWLLDGGAVVIGLVLLLSLCRPQGASRASHGTARWATPAEVRRAGLYAPQGIVVGRHGTQVLHSATGHVLLCGPTGSGKDR